MNPYNLPLLLDAIGKVISGPMPNTRCFFEAKRVEHRLQLLSRFVRSDLPLHIECDTDGTILKILVENGQPVEYGEPLFHIEPAL